MQTDKKLEHNKPDITVVDKVNQRTKLIGVACPFDSRIVKKEDEKHCAYNPLRDLENGGGGDSASDCRGIGNKRSRKIYIKKISIQCPIELLQKGCLLGTARIDRKVLDT